MSSLQCISLFDMSPAPLPAASVVCLGNFDGVHLAHRALLREARRLCNTEFTQASCAAFCFRTPSTDFLAPDKASHLCTLEQKLRRFRDEGLDYAILIDFPEIRDLSPEQFANNILRDGCHAVAAVCGFNYRFGKGGKGTPELLRSTLQIPVSVQSEISFCGETVSSTRIRRLLTEGRVEEANALLTLPYSFTAEVVHGKALGQKMGFPTVNQVFPDRMLIPRHGVYVTDCEIDGKHYRAISNVGAHPTVDTDAQINCETYILDLCADLYGKQITVSFLKFLRPEQKFESIEALTAQIGHDLIAARDYRA